MAQDLVVGLGNPILTDDGVGLCVAREVARRLPELGLANDVDVELAEVGGFALLELLIDRRRVVLVDAVLLPGVVPGTLRQLSADEFRASSRLRSVHELDLGTALKLGEALGLKMPQEITVFAIQADDTVTFAERLTPAVAAIVPEAVSRILSVLKAG
jgi:hydrogenase maturation protease